MYVHIYKYIPWIFIHLNYHVFTYSVDLVQDGAAGNTEVDFGQKHISLQLIILSYEKLGTIGNFMPGERKRQRYPSSLGGTMIKIKYRGFSFLCDIFFHQMSRCIILQVRRPVTV